MRIVDLRTLGPGEKDQAASLLVEGFAEHWPAAWPDFESAKGTVLECLSAARICRAAVGGDANVLGWSAAEPIYQGNVWSSTFWLFGPTVSAGGLAALSFLTWNCRSALGAASRFG